MRKFILALVVLCAASPLFAKTETVNGIVWTYAVSDGEATIGYQSAALPTSTTGAITIPSTLGGYPVTGIGNDAFRGCSGLTSVTMLGERPDTPKRPDGIFEGCGNLKSIHVLANAKSWEGMKNWQGIPLAFVKDDGTVVEEDTP